MSDGLNLTARSLKQPSVNGHIESHYNVKRGTWTKPEFVEDPFIRIHGMVSFPFIKIYSNAN